MEPTDINNFMKVYTDAPLEYYTVLLMSHLPIDYSAHYSESPHYSVETRRNKRWPVNSIPRENIVQGT